jgi:hypothetical protein
MSANPPARLEDEFCISCERMLLLPIWGGVFEGDSFAVSINGRSLLIFVVAHGVLCKWVCEVWRGGAKKFLYGSVACQQLGLQMGSGFVALVRSRQALNSFNSGRFSQLAGHVVSPQ